MKIKIILLLFYYYYKKNRSFYKIYQDLKKSCKNIKLILLQNYYQYSLNEQKRECNTLFR